MKRTVLPDFSAARGRRLLVALSGGADSVALTCMLAEAREALGLTLYAAHIDHGIRPDSRADAEFCRQLCRELDIPICVERIDVPSIAAQSGEGLETAARRLRYDALRRIREDVGAEWIALAHHLDDQAETVLMHLLRGCGPEGIGGMKILSGDLYRPLLNTPKRTLESWLAAHGVVWRVDSTNLEPCTPRNALRLHGLPALEESYPSAATALARYAEAAQCEDRCMQRLVDAFLESNLDRGPYGARIRAPETADEAILRRAIRAICGAELPHERLIEAVALSRQSRGRMEISGNLFAERTPNALYFLPKHPVLPEVTPLPAEGRAAFGELGTLQLRPCAAVPIRDDPDRQVLRRSALAGAVLRTRRDGDRIRPLGCGDRLLSDYLTDRKVDRPLRDFLPLVTVGSRVLWAVGLGIAEEAKLRSGSDDAVLLEWRAGMK